MDFETRNDVTITEYIEMIKLKTSVLLGGSIKSGAIIGRADEKNAQLIYDFGCNTGISFQLQDDWLDVYGNSNDFGKPIGGDIISNKKTFLLITALNDLKESSKKELLQWLKIEEFDKNAKIAAIKNLYEEAKISKKTQEKINFYFENSLKQLFKVTGSKEILNELEEFIHTLMVRSR
jgi:geranylgeranyl diphosphate synthase type II